MRILEAKVGFDEEASLREGMGLPGSGGHGNVRAQTPGVARVSRGQDG